MKGENGLMDSNDKVKNSNEDKVAASSERKVKNSIESALTEGYVLERTAFDFLGSARVGKVRDMYERANEIVMITTDRQSAFDKVLALVPFKGRVLSEVSGNWFEQIKEWGTVPHHIIASPHPHVHIVKKLQMFPVEFVVRGYLTGVSATSVWTAYEKGERQFAGHDLPEGMVKNQAFSKSIITPSTKSETGDETISGEDIVIRGLMTERDRDECFEVVAELFKRGQEVAMKRGMILVDTKYELGKDRQGRIVLGDEVHTPDSSRYWLAEEYEERLKRNEEPKNIDKEFLRRWFTEHSDPYKDTPLPAAPRDLIIELAYRYIMLYERITGMSFDVRETMRATSLVGELETLLRKEFPSL